MRKVLACLALLGAMAMPVTALAVAKGDPPPPPPPTQLCKGPGGTVVICSDPLPATPAPTLTPTDPPTPPATKAPAPATPPAPTPPHK